MKYLTDIWDEIVTWCHGGVEPGPGIETITYGLLFVTDNAAWAALTTGAMCAYNNDVNNVYAVY